MWVRMSVTIRRKFPDDFDKDVNAFFWKRRNQSPNKIAQGAEGEYLWMMLQYWEDIKE